MNRVAPLLLLAVLLAGCAGTDAMPDPQCREAADRDPQVKDKRASNAGKAGIDLTERDRNDLALLQKDAYTRCLRLRGLAPPGGVERVRPS